jgi:hypothetical protein
MRRLQSFLRLPARERFLYLQTWLLLFRIRLMLWLLPYRRWRQTAARMIHIKSERQLERPQVNQITRAVKVTSRYVPQASCLTQALAAQTLLAKAGQRSQLRVGVTHKDGKVEAHAWVQVDGRVVIGGRESVARFSAFPTLELES